MHMDMQQFMDGLAAAKTGFDILRSAVGLIRDAETVLPADKKDAVSRALDEADKQIRLAEAQIAQALGYTLCRCAFPPTPMLVVGFRLDARNHTDVEVHECPVCKRDDAMGWAWSRYQTSSEP
jgi:hypothetical protein